MVVTLGKKKKVKKKYKNPNPVLPSVNNAYYLQVKPPPQKKMYKTINKEFLENEVFSILDFLSKYLKDT